MTWVATAIGVSSLYGAQQSKEAAEIQANATKYGIDTQKAMFDLQNQQQQPYRQTAAIGLNELAKMGTSGEALSFDILHPEKSPGIVQGTGYFSKPYSMDEFKQGMDPGYQFRLQQGQDLARRAGNVGGGLVGGNVMKGLEDYTQKSASDEFMNAFNRSQTEKTNIYNRLASMAGLGQTSLGQSGTLSANTANNLSQLAVAGGNAAAGGVTGSANALTGGLNTFANYQMLQNLRNPTFGTPTNYGNPVSSPLDINIA